MIGADQFAAYRQGWKDGAQTLDLKAKRGGFMNGATADTYNSGFRDGQESLTAALQYASDLYGYDHTNYMRGEGAM